jgi:hypothetical protein
VITQEQMDQVLERLERVLGTVRGQVKRGEL